MEILDLRQIRARDLELLLEEETGLWKKHLLWNYGPSADLIKRFVDSQSLSGYAAIENGRAVGYSFFVYEDHKGLIGNLFVSGPFRGSTENRLLTHVIETLQGTPGIRRIEAQLMIFGAGKLEPAFRQGSFSVRERKFMFREIGPGEIGLPPRHLPDIEFLAWDDRFFENTAALITQAYRDHVDSEINDQYRSLAGALRFLSNIVQYPGCGAFHSQASWAAFQKGRKTPCGVILTSVVNEGIGHVTQVCAAPEWQGRGVGYELMRRSAESFRAAGFTGLSLTVTSANHPAVALYERMGFRTLQEFSAYAWDSSSA